MRWDMSVEKGVIIIMKKKNHFICLRTRDTNVRRWNDKRGMQFYIRGFIQMMEILFYREEKGRRGVRDGSWRVNLIRFIRGSSCAILLLRLFFFFFSTRMYINVNKQNKNKKDTKAWIFSVVKRILTLLFSSDISI